MTVVLLAVIIATLLGLAFRGSLTRFGQPRTTRNGLLAFAAVAEGAALIGKHPSVAACWLGAAAIALAVYARLNRGRPGLLLAALGLVLNVAVIVANNGMPVSLEAADRAGVPASRVELTTDPLRESLNEATLLPWLSESIPLALPLRPAVASAGDLLIAAGAAVFLFTGLTGRGRPMPAPPEAKQKGGRRKAKREAAAAAAAGTPVMDAPPAVFDTAVFDAPAADAEPVPSARASRGRRAGRNARKDPFSEPRMTTDARAEVGFGAVEVAAAGASATGATTAGAGAAGGTAVGAAAAGATTASAAAAGGTARSSQGAPAAPAEASVSAPPSPTPHLAEPHAPAAAEPVSASGDLAADPEVAASPFSGSRMRAQVVAPPAADVDSTVVMAAPTGQPPPVGERPASGADQTDAPGVESPVNEPASPAAPHFDRSSSPVVEEPAPADEASVAGASVAETTPAEQAPAATAPVTENTQAEQAPAATAPVIDATPADQEAATVPVAAPPRAPAPRAGRGARKALPGAARSAPARRVAGRHPATNGSHAVRSEPPPVVERESTPLATTGNQGNGTPPPPSAPQTAPREETETSEEAISATPVEEPVRPVERREGPPAAWRI